MFSMGIIGTGMLAVPVLAGSAAYAMADCSVDPIKVLFWSAVINGVIAVPIMVMLIDAQKIFCALERLSAITVQSQQQPERIAQRGVVLDNEYRLLTRGRVSRNTYVLAPSCGFF